MGKKKSKKISDSAYLKLQEMITDGLDSVLESMNEVLKNYPYPEKEAGAKEKPPVILILAAYHRIGDALFYDNIAQSSLNHHLENERVIYYTR